MKASAEPADLHDRDERVRRIASNALSAGLAEVRLWGGLVVAVFPARHARA
jgi:hypothetical protein